MQARRGPEQLAVSLAFKSTVDEKAVTRRLLLRTTKMASTAILGAVSSFSGTQIDCRRRVIEYEEFIAIKSSNFSVSNNS